MAFLGKDFICIICFLKAQLYLSIYLICVFICQSPVSLRFFYLTIFQRWIFFKDLVWFFENIKTRSWQIVESFKG